MPGYFQPVEIKAPGGAHVSLPTQNVFGAAQNTPLEVGMLIAPVYRLRITNIPLLPGVEVYPTIEVVNRLYPPVGLEGRFPIPIDITQEDIELALQGKFVTRIVYLENPDYALPVGEDPDRQSWFEVAPEQDPLAVADGLGRPMAILRIGARVPDAEGPTAAFMFGSPPLLRFTHAQSAAAARPAQPEAEQAEAAASRTQLGATR